MNAANMMTPDSRHRSHAVQGAMSASNFDLTPSLFANPHFTYPMQYNSLDLSYDLGLGFDGYNAATGASASPQEIFGHLAPSYSEAALQSQEPLQAMPGHEMQRSPTIKIEAVSQDSANINFEYQEVQQVKLPAAARDNEPGTDVDTLMRAIQTKTDLPMPYALSSTTFDSSSDSPSSDSNSPSSRTSGRRCSQARRSYPCKMQSCAKVFAQKTHLEIHMRAHTGYKPYVRAPQNRQTPGYADDRLD